MAMQFVLWLCRVVLIMIGAGRMGKCGSMSWEPDFIFGLVVALIGIIIVLYTATQVEGDRKELFTRATSQAGELQASKERCSQLQRKLEETEKRESEQSMKAAEMKARVTSLERERDDLQQQLEEKKKQLCQKPASPGAMEMVTGFFGLLLKSSQARVHYEGSTGITGDFALGGVSFGRN